MTNLRNEKGGDKIEFIGAGSLGVGEMAGYIKEVYKTDANECDIMRLDATGDIEGSWVPWCRDNVRVKGKQCYQEETPGSDSTRKYGRHTAETIYWGKGSRQITVYDKTGQRRAQLMQERSKMLREEKANLRLNGGPTREGMSLELHFQQKFGYSIFEQKTRFERRMGGREIATAFDIPKFGNIQKAAFIDPYEQMQFPEQNLDGWDEWEPKELEFFALQYLIDFKERHGLTFMRNEVFRKLPRSSAYKWLKKISPYLMPTGTGPTREMVRKAYVASTLIQLAA